MGIKPFLQVRLYAMLACLQTRVSSMMFGRTAPRLVQPVSGVGDGLARYRGNGVVALAGLLEKRVTLVRLRNWRIIGQSCHNEAKQGLYCLPGMWW